MNIKHILGIAAGTPATCSSSELGEQLKLIVDTSGTGVFKDPGRMQKALEEHNIGQAAKHQLLLAAAASNIGEFTANIGEGLSLVDVDNAVHDIVASTGLAHKTALQLVIDILYACGLDFAVESGFAHGKHGVEKSLHALMPNELADSEAKRARQLAQKLSEAGFATQEEAAAAVREATAAIARLCEAGVPTGFYLLGRCYYLGELGTEQNMAKAVEYLSAASEMGCAEASTMLGSLHYSSKSASLRDYTRAHCYFTRPGALALGTERQALEDIYMQGSANLATLFMSGLIFVLTLLFTAYFCARVPSSGSCMLAAAFANIISASVVGLAAASFARKRFNSIKGLLAVQYFAWAFYALVLISE
ncbi:MAG: hypothetical protein FWG53_09850 [Clostridiales bacterium]|nr:hypothetical protein [Clostridiales bacterium]